MLIVTGGAGFIGSAIIWELNNRLIDDIIVVDEFSRLSIEKKKNLKNLNYKDLIDKEDFLTKLKKGHYLDAGCIIHMGACSKTTEIDEDYIMYTNYQYTRDLAEIALGNNMHFIYASSAATYGDGLNGFDDSHEELKLYEPLNIYGDSKHRFDLWAFENGLLEKITGLKYFNVYGPNEYHKSSMRSFVVKAYEQITQTGKVRLFKSYNEKYENGKQLRDFIYIKDAVDMTLHFFNNKDLKGIYNIGTGVPRTWNDLVKAVFKALNIVENIEYIDMPDDIKDQYQYYTCSNAIKFNNTGYNKTYCSLEDGIKDYVENYLVVGKYLESVSKS